MAVPGAILAGRAATPAASASRRDGKINGAEAELHHAGGQGHGGPQAAAASRVSTMSTEKVSSAVFSSMAEAEQYFSCDSCTARSTAARAGRGRSR